MAKNRFKKIAIKVGSNIIAREDGQLNTERIGNIVKQIAQLRKQGVEVVLISSGAVAAGKKYVGPKIKKNDIVSIRQVASAIGQVKLIHTYARYFQEHDLICSQVLLTKDDIRDRQHYSNIKNCLVKLLQADIIPIINENDVISVTELMFTDNDELAGLVASIVGCDALFILSNINGIFNGPPDDPNSEVIPEIDLNKPFSIHNYISTGKSNFGRGGMITKYNMAQKIAKYDITVYITNGRKDDIVLTLMEDDKAEPNTKFRPVKQSKNSEVQKWLSVAQEFYTGTVYINNGAKKALFSNKATSLLLVGLSKIKGTFKKGDIIKIMDMNENLIGVGKAQYDSDTARAHLGEQQYKPLVHYDYLYVD